MLNGGDWLRFSVRQMRNEDSEQLKLISGQVYHDGQGSVLDDILKSASGLAYVAVDDPSQEVIGYVVVTSMNPQNLKVRIELVVHRNHRGNGIGAYLLSMCTSEIKRNFRPEVIQVRVLEDASKAVEFFLKRGFIERHRMLKAVLAVNDWSFPEYAVLERQLLSKNIEITNMTSEQERESDFFNKMYELHNHTAPDFPRDNLEQFVPEPFEQFWLRNDHSHIPESFFIAKASDEYIGYAYLGKPFSDGRLWNGFTAVRREYRGMGIATVLKCRTIHYAQCHGYQHIFTSYRNTNTPMRAVNEKLGWKHYSSEIRMELSL